MLILKTRLYTMGYAFIDCLHIDTVVEGIHSDADA